MFGRMDSRQNMTSGILRLRYRKSQEKHRNWRIRERRITSPWTCGPQAMFFLQRPQAAAGSFQQPISRASTATSTHGEEQARAIRMIKATNVIYHDKAHPSALIVASGAVTGGRAQPRWAGPQRAREQGSPGVSKTR